jgi:hypothetical protein
VAFLREFGRALILRFGVQGLLYVTEQRAFDGIG